MPEVASRQHILEIAPVLEATLRKGGFTWKDIDAIAVTRGPGLAGALLVGVNAAKALAFGLGLPLVGVNHLEGHIYANWLEEGDPELDPGFPLLCLIASGRPFRSPVDGGPRPIYSPGPHEGRRRGRGL